MNFAQHKTPFSPYFIVIKQYRKMDDNILLEKLGIEGYTLSNIDQKGNFEKLPKRNLFLTEDSEWTYLMDDWHYTLWHNDNIRIRLKELCKEFEIFTCSIGDIDESFYFSYLLNGEIVRQHIVEDPNFNGGEVVSDIGIPFLNENIALQEQDAYNKISIIAKSLGINLNQSKHNIRVYERFQNESDSFVFNTSEY